MSEALCRCGHGPTVHVGYTGGCGLCDACVGYQAFTPAPLSSPPPTREPIRLTAEEREAIRGALGWDESFAAVESILAARLTGGPTLADAWDEGFDKGAHYALADLSHATYRTPPPSNPYREESA